MARTLTPGLTHQTVSAFYDALNDPEYGASLNLDKTVMRYAMKQKGMDDDEALGMDVSRELLLENTPCVI